MRIPLSWLKEYIDVTLPPSQIAKILTLAGLEVDGVETTSLGFENVVVGLVKKVERHPNAEKLTVATVTDGMKDYQVVCGASNCREGMKTAFAMVGASIEEEGGASFKIKKAKLRGIDSFGMLCSGKELRLSDESEGILEFAEHLKEGADVAEIYADTIFEISLTPNLTYCASMFGTARELSAAIETPVHFPEVHVDEKANTSISKETQVTIVDKENCPRYCCRLIKGIKIAPSPDWLQKRLLACGVRPVNNVVDITNYVLLEMGHPLHAFDFNQLAGKQIVVRSAEEGEVFETLDGKKRVLTKENLLICDQEKPIAIAGVMGGLNSEVSDQTTDVLLEAAYFLPASVRKTSKQLGLQTDASKRFERGCDPNQPIISLDRATMLIQKIAGGEVIAGIIDEKEHPLPEKEVLCRLSRINHVLGTQLATSEVEAIFTRLGLAYRSDGQDALAVTVPTYRVDLDAEIDLIEEVARIYGYENIEKPGAIYRASTLDHAPIYLFEKEMRARLIAEGLQEFLTCDLIGPSILEAIHEVIMPEEAYVKVLNPTSIEQSILRTSLLPGMLEVVKYNVDHQSPNISGFEVGRIHFKEGNQYKEQSVASIVLSGKQRMHHWDVKPSDVDFFDLKGMIENILDEMQVKSVEFKKSTLQIFHPGRQASICIGSREIGSLGEVHPAVLRRLDVPQRIFFAEIDLHELFQERAETIKMEEIPVYPSSERDWTVTLGEHVQVRDVIDRIQQVPSRLLESVSLLDVYRGEKLGKDRKNVTFHFVYRDKKKTVAQEAVDAEHARIVGQVEKG